MSWTTSPPYSIKSVSRQQTESTAATTPPPVPSPKSVPRSLTILNTSNNSNNNKGKPRTPIAPHKLAQLANALGVATPSPGSVPYPLYSPSTPNSASFGTSNQAPSRYLLHVIPPLHLLQAEQEDANDPHVRAQFRRGTLVSLHPTLPSQLGAIAREFSLPSTGGMILYLITAENDAGPRITDDAWRMLWFRALQIDKDGSVNGKNIARYHSRSTTSNSPYPSPSSTSESPYGRLASPPSTSDNTPASSIMSLELPINVNPGAALPILAKVEFDIDRRKAPWYEIWKHRRRTASHSIANSPQYSSGLSSSTSSKRVLQLPLRARSTSPSLAGFKAKYTSSGDGSPGEGYARLDDEFGYVNRGAHLGQFTDDPLEDVFPSDRNTWAQIRVQHDNGDGDGRPHTPDMLIGGRIGSTILSLDGAHEEEDFDENEEDVVRMWKQNHKPTLDSLGTPISPGMRSAGTRSRSASKHVPPPLDLTASSKSQIPHVEVAPPTATSPNMSINSDLPYLDSDGTMNPGQKAKKGGNDSGSEEARSRRLDELERRIENLSPRSQWDEEATFQQSPLMESPESTSPLKESVPIFTFDEHGDSEQTDSTNDNGPASKSSLPVPSTKASRRQVSIGSFNALPNASDLAKALAAASNSPPLPAVPLEDEDARLEREEERDVIDISPVDLATPMTPGFPISPDPFNKRPGFGIQSEVEKSDLTLITNVPASGSPVSPPPRMSSRFSADSVTSEDGQQKSRNDRTGSVISVKGIRSLWRKSGNSKNMPLMSPGINGQQIIPPTPPPFMEAGFVPPLPLSSGGYFSPISMAPPPLPTKSAASNADASGAPPGTPRAPTPSSVHRRSESGLDPFHFDQDSRYPVHKMPSPSQAFPDQFPPTEPLATSPPPPPPSKKGILKGWGSKGSSMKRTSTELINAGRTSTSSPQPSSHPPSSFGSTVTSKKAKRPSISGILGNSGHSKQNSKASISSVGTNSKHTYPNNSLSGTSHASSHHDTSSAASLPEPPSNLGPAAQSSASGRSSQEAAPGHKSSGSNGSALTMGEPRKSTPPPVGAVAMAAAVAASRERRGTSYIGPADNRI